MTNHDDAEEEWPIRNRRGRRGAPATKGDRGKEWLAFAAATIAGCLVLLSIVQAIVG